MTTTMDRSIEYTPEIDIEVRSEITRWRQLFRIAAGAGILMLATIPAAVAVYVIWPPPYDEPASEWIRLYQDNWLLGLLSLDLLFMLSNLVLIPIYLALYVTLRRGAEALMALALAIGLVSVASYLSSNPAFQMLELANRYESATSPDQQLAILGAVEAMMATFEGTAFNVYYVLSAIALLLITWSMLRGNIFGRTTAYVGLVAGLFMLIPATAGTLGLIFSLASLIPWVAFLVLITIRFMQLSRVHQPA